ncbi:hypothetical protein ACFQ08_21125 [Streptosporangium algeriense]|uniref:Uncharacterized protein n=1 Tax=Streptosporangium algeriense TaxID=1682748 RepID=A0ABW3DVD4_9ACTN
MSALVLGAVFGAATSLVNATSHHYADLESEVATTSGASVIEIVSVLIDSGWAWAGLAVAMGWLATRTKGAQTEGAQTKRAQTKRAQTEGVQTVETRTREAWTGETRTGGTGEDGLGREHAGENRSGTLVHGAVAGAVALLTATPAYGFADTVWRGEPLATWYLSESPVWWVAGVVFGAPLGAVGACVTRPGVIGLLARMVVPVGAAVQMVVLPPGRNERITVIGQAVVWTLAALFAGFVIVRFLGGRRSAPPGPEAAAQGE